VDKNQSLNLENSTGKILIVDDEIVNRELLKEILNARGFETEEAEDGIQALQKVQESPPDVILLDIMMPRMDGFEVCQKIKSDIVTAPIPVIIMTSLTDRKARLKGIDAGANDFLTKPIDTRDVVLRVRNAALSKRLYDQVQAQYKKLKELEELRDNLVHMLIHDMKSPLFSILGNLEILKTRAVDNTEKEIRYINTAYEQASVLFEMINSLIDVKRMESGQMPLKLIECDVRDIIQDVLKMFIVLTLHLKIIYNEPPVSKMVLCDKDIIRRVVMNLFYNAIRFTPEEGEVMINIKEEEYQVTVSISDTGLGIPLEYHTKIFEKFGQVTDHGHTIKYSSGLGLTFCKLAIEAHGGKIDVESEKGKGSTFWFSLKKNHST
jgi:two-component system sensor histidine kinase/response regulator